MLCCQARLADSVSGVGSMPFRLTVSTSDGSNGQYLIVNRGASLYNLCSALLNAPAIPASTRGIYKVESGIMVEINK